MASALLSARSVFEHRAVVVGDPAAGLAALVQGRPSPGVVEGVATRTAHRAVFVFPGQGSQWAGMAVRLLDAEPVFAAAIDECEGALGSFVDWSLVGVLRSGDFGWLGRVDVVQPVLFAVMVGLARLWESVGVRPVAVTGHSQGEIAAAYVAGVLSLGDAARVVALRSRAIRVISGRGGMVSVGLPVAEVEGLLPVGVGVAAVNGAESTVVSGDVEGLEVLLADAERLGVRARRVPVDYASHSPHVEELRERILADLAVIRPVSGSVPFYSAVTGGVVDGVELDAAYWYRNLRQPVRFHDVTKA
ncbi:acyltransferase domain-containing protein, partial [Micromonospora sp. DT233]|uniref:acyltransferase domain-containing protein n=1 Tax=Micromonospora sp. DT233 TaxID=3393432 RepID=UPI003CEB0D3D